VVVNGEAGGKFDIVGPVSIDCSIVRGLHMALQGKKNDLSVGATRLRKQSMR
jgi:hypothetical protein